MKRAVEVFLLSVVVLVVSTAILLAGLYIYVKEEGRTPGEVSSATLKNI